MHWRGERQKEVLGLALTGGDLVMSVEQIFSAAGVFAEALRGEK